MVREKFQTITSRFASYQAQWLNVHGDFPLLQRIALPISIGSAKVKGVKRVCIPNRSTKSPERKRKQKKRWFRNGQKWRTGFKVTVSQLTDPDKLKHFQDAQNQLTGVLGRLLAITESYPDLTQTRAVPLVCLVSRDYSPILS